MRHHPRTILSPGRQERAYAAAFLIPCLALAVALGGCQPAPEPPQEEPEPVPDLVPEPVVEAPPPAPPAPPEPEIGEAHYLKDTPWSPGAEGKLMLGLDGGRYEPYLAPLVRDAQTILFQQKLYDGPVTGVLDRRTMEAVGELQKKHGIKPSGVLSPRTRIVMEILSQQKLYDGPVTGVLDRRMMDAIGELQKETRHQAQ